MDHLRNCNVTREIALHMFDSSGPVDMIDSDVSWQPNMHLFQLELTTSQIDVILKINH